MKMFKKIIQDVDEFVSSMEQIWRNVALHPFITIRSSLVNGCHQNESPNNYYKHHNNPQVNNMTPSVNAL